MKNRGLIIGLAGLLSSTAMPGLAQSAFAQDVPVQEAEISGNDIVVTARRTAERLQDVPLSITAFNAEALEEKGVRDVYDLQQSSPGLAVASDQTQGRTAGTYNIRGQGQPSPSGAPGVVTYLNDVPVYGTEIVRAFFDLETVQVLKGPQGTLFGKNTNGGAILFNTRRPTDEFEGYLTARYGNFNDRYLEGAINVPIMDGIGIRLAGNIERRDGFTRNISGPDLDNLKYHNLRGTLRVAPVGSGFENILVINSTRIDERDLGYKVFQVFPTPPVLGGQTMSAARQAVLNQALSLSDRVVDNPNPGFQYVRAMGATNNTTLEVADGVTLKNIVGYHQVKFNARSDLDNTSLDFLSADFNRFNEQFTEEFQVQADFMDGRIKTIAGFFYLSDKVRPLSPGDRRTPSDATVFASVLTPEGLQNVQQNLMDQSSRALFGQVSAKLAPTLTLTAGYRYTWDRIETQGRQQRTFLPGTVLLPPFIPKPFTVCSFPAAVSNPDPRFRLDLPNCTLYGKARFGASNYNVSLDWKPSDELLLYVTHRHGYKSGGINTTTPFYGFGNIYQPEMVDDVEAGVKASGALGTMRYTVNASAFHSWYDQLQLNQIINDALTGPQDLIQNTGSARLWGGDLEVNLEPVRGLSFNGTLAYFDGKFTEQTGVVLGRDSLPINLVGRKYRTLPRFRWTLGASYRGEVGQAGTASASVFMSRSESYYLNYDVYDANLVPGYTVVNARVGIENLLGSTVSIAGYARNLTNSLYKLGTNGSPTFGFAGNTFGEPRTYGVEVGFKF